MSVIEVKISRKDGEYVPSVNPISLSKKANQKIKWVNDTDQKITISFAGNSPFPAKLNPYVIPAGRHADSGHIEADADTNWHYTINGTAVAAAASVASISASVEAKADLPDIIIHP